MDRRAHTTHSHVTRPIPYDAPLFDWLIPQLQKAGKKSVCWYSSVLNTDKYNRSKHLQMPNLKQNHWFPFKLLKHLCIYSGKYMYHLSQHSKVHFPHTRFYDSYYKRPLLPFVMGNFYRGHPVVLNGLQNKQVLGSHTTVVLISP
jgi:hypothetical protein